MGDHGGKLKCGVERAWGVCVREWPRAKRRNGRLCLCSLHQTKSPHPSARPRHGPAPPPPPSPPPPLRPRVPPSPRALSARESGCAVTRNTANTPPEVFFSPRPPTLSFYAPRRPPPPPWPPLPHPPRAARTGRNSSTCRPRTPASRPRYGEMERMREWVFFSRPVALVCEPRVRGAPGLTPTPARLCSRLMPCVRARAEAVVGAVEGRARVRRGLFRGWRLIAAALAFFSCRARPGPPRAWPTLVSPGSPRLGKGALSWEEGGGGARQPWAATHTPNRKSECSTTAPPRPLTPKPRPLPGRHPHQGQ